MRQKNQPGAIVLRGLCWHALAFVSSTAAYGEVIATDQWSLQLFGVNAKVLFAAFFGSIGALAFLPPFSGQVRMIVAVIIGTVASAYGVQLFGKWMGWGVDTYAPIAFFMGLGAHTLLTLAFTNGPKLLLKRLGGGDA